MDTKGELQEYFKFENFGTSNGIGFHLNIKLNIKKNSRFLPYITIGFVQLQNDEVFSYIDSNVISGGYPLPGSLFYNSKVPGKSLLVFRDLSVGFGLQYSASAVNALIPFTGIELCYRKISGFYNQNPQFVTGQNSLGNTTFDINPVSRLGIGIDAGVDYRISKYLGFVFGGKFNISNLIGKNSEKTMEKNKINFLDKAAPELNSNLNSSRNFSYFELYIGFVVFAGRF
jgi:hypothetical protein